LKRSLPWLRLYTDAWRNIKLRRLSNETFRFWFNVICMAAEQGGAIPPTEDMAFLLNIPLEKARSMMNDLVSARLVDLEGGIMSIHNWEDRQYVSDNSAERTRAYRERKRNSHRDAAKPSQEQDATVTVTPPDTEQIQSRADTEQSRPEIPLPPAAPRPKLAQDLKGVVSQQFARFWALYPMQDNQHMACQMYLSTVTMENETRVFACLERYIRSAAVSDGAIKSAWKWLQEQAQNDWRGQWPAPRVNGRIDPAESLLKKIAAEKGLNGK
jgi:hypothetical protein